MSSPIIWVVVVCWNIFVFLKEKTRKRAGTDGNQKGAVMSTTVVYEAIDDYQVNCERGEISERVEQLLDPPTVGDTLKMGSERLWHIVAVESYVNAGSTIFLALVHPLGAPVPARTEWNQAMQRELHPDVCLNLSDRADRGLAVGSWNMCGKPLTGRLYGGVPNDHPTRS